MITITGMAETDLAIIGGGASCVLLLAQLARDPQAKGMRIDVYERSGNFGRGIAYSTKHECHLLNVRAANMSAYHAEKDHFAQWASSRGYDALSFVPRKLYGDYLAERLEEAKGILSLNLIEADVTSVKKVSKEQYDLTYGTRKRSYLNVVQATGNVMPQRPKVVGDVADYYDDPWNADFASLSGKQHVALIGSGLTAVDMVLALYAKNYTGRISVFSRHALPPATHVDPCTYPNFIGENEQNLSAYGLLHLIRQHVKEARKQGAPWQAVIDSLRSHTNAIWAHWSKRERERFMKRLFTIWNVHRHRTAPQIAEALSILVKAGRVEFIKSGVEHIGAGPVVHGRAGDYPVDAVINCLGYRYREEGYRFEVSDKIGPACFGDLFETTAIPEIRSQAASIAVRILQNY